jgi:hypothetical protein
MPWKESLKMDQKKDFAMKSLTHPTFRKLCREYGISAKTGYKWRERLPARTLPEEVVCDIIRIKQAHPKTCKP